MLAQDEKGVNPEIEKWFDAYEGLMQEASAGRLFRGIVHNLNGVIQAFSMQSELFGLMFQQTDQFLAQIKGGTEIEKEKAIVDLGDLLVKRAVLAEQMAEKVQLCRQIVQRTLLLQAYQDVSDTEALSLSELLAEETTFLSADPFFKHKVIKRVAADKGLLVPSGDIGEIRLALQVVMQNALEAVREQENPIIEIQAQRDEEHLLIIIQDNGCGVPEALLHMLYKPFVSNKEKHAGLGLFIARRAVEKIGGQIELLPRQQGTAFALRLRAFPPKTG